MSRFCLFSVAFVAAYISSSCVSGFTYCFLSNIASIPSSLIDDGDVPTAMTTGALVPTPPKNQQTSFHSATVVVSPISELATADVVNISFVCHFWF